VANFSKNFKQPLEGCYYGFSFFGSGSDQTLPLYKTQTGGLPQPMEIK